MGEERDSYRFTHDYVKLAVFSMVPAENRNATYFLIGHSIWKNSSKEEIQDNLFSIVNMLNLAQTQLNSNEKKSVAKLDLKAAKTSIFLTAFQSALNFLEAGIKLLDDDCWLNDYHFTLKYYRFAAKTAYCVMNYGKMMNFLNTLVRNANSELDTIPSYVLQIRALNHQNKYADALQIGLSVIEAFGEKLNIEIDDELILNESNKTLRQ